MLVAVENIGLDLIFECYFRVTDGGLVHIVRNCKHIVDLNISGCKVHGDTLEL